MSNITIGILFWFGTGVVTVLFALINDYAVIRKRYGFRVWQMFQSKADIWAMMKIISVGPIGLFFLISKR